MTGTDTDSGIYVVTKLVSSYEENRKLGERIDTLVHQHMSEHMVYSNYPREHPFYDKTFKKNFHRFQNEHPLPALITEAIATGPKGYVLTVINADEFNTMDGAWDKVKQLYGNMIKYSEDTNKDLLKRQKGLSYRYIVERDDYFLESSKRVYTNILMVLGRWIRIRCVRKRAKCSL